MKISVDDLELFTLSETEKNIIKNDISHDIFEADMKRRLRWVLIDVKVNKCLERLKAEWAVAGMDAQGNRMPSKLEANGVTSLPIDDMALADLIFSQDNTKPFPYKSKKARDNEAAAQQGVQ